MICIIENVLTVQPLGAIDYLEISKQFDTLILRDIPDLTLEKRVEGRRFITLIDTIYDNKVKIRSGDIMLSNCIILI